MPEKDDRSEYIRNMAFAAMAGQAGCASVGMIIGALFLGIWMDAILDTRPAFTLGLVLISVPASLGMMVYIALKATKQITPPKTPRRSSVHRYDEDES
ncbi:MAG: AtpZ/AtpI family protein [Anaerolineae bacterium]|nr:AtpZ/AtpI family protein [Anaerolineae bacterium]